MLEGSEYRKRRRYGSFLRELERFLGELKHCYYMSFHVAEAVFDAAEETGPLLRGELERIVSILEGEDIEEETADYQAEKHDRFLKLFLIQCANAVLYGSGETGKESLFVRNMIELRREVQNACFKHTQSSFLFAGLTIITVLPIAFLPGIRIWGIHNLEDLQGFYEGNGRLLAGAACFLTALCYGMLHLLKEGEGRRVKAFCFLDGLYEKEAVKRICFAYERKAGERMKRQRSRLKEAGSRRTPGEFFVLRLFLPALCFFCGVEYFLYAVLAKGEVRAGILYSLFPCMALLFLLPGLLLRYMAYLRRLGMGGEVLGLQSIVLMLMYVPNMTMMKLLQTMEMFSELFGEEIAACADEYQPDGVEALLRLKEQESYPPFRQFVNQMIVSDKIGLLRAFEEVAQDRLYFREQQRLDTEQELKRKAANAQVLAFIPLFFVLAAYLVIPFLVSGMRQMEEILREMNTIGF